MSQGICSGPAAESGILIYDQLVLQKAEVLVQNVLCSKDIGTEVALMTEGCREVIVFNVHCGKLRLAVALVHVVLEVTFAYEGLRRPTYVAGEGPILYSVGPRDVGLQLVCPEELRGAVGAEVGFLLIMHSLLMFLQAGFICEIFATECAGSGDLFLMNSLLVTLRVSLLSECFPTGPTEVLAALLGRLNVEAMSTACIEALVTQTFSRLLAKEMALKEFQLI